MITHQWGILKEITGSLKHKDTISYLERLESDTVARTIWGETRDLPGSYEDMEAVASVLSNRFMISTKKGNYWWGDTLSKICQKPYQFAGWNRSGKLYRNMLDVAQDDKDFMYCKELAKDIIAFRLLDVTGGATHYHKVGVWPYWAQGETPTYTTDILHFYKMVS